MPFRPTRYARIRRRYQLLMTATGLLGAAGSAAIHVRLARNLLAVEGSIPGSFVGFALLLTALAGLLPAAIVFFFMRRWRSRHLRERGYLF